MAKISYVKGNPVLNEVCIDCGNDTVYRDIVLIDWRQNFDGILLCLSCFYKLKQDMEEIT